MFINGVINLFVYKKKEKEFDNNGSKMKYYRLIIDNDDDVEEIACTEECYKSALPGKINKLAFTYNTKGDRNPFKFTGVEKNDGKQ